MTNDYQFGDEWIPVQQKLRKVKNLGDLVVIGKIFVRMLLFEAERIIDEIELENGSNDPKNETD